MAREVCRKGVRTDDGRITVIVLERRNGEYYTKALDADGRLIEGLTAQIALTDGMDERTAVDRAIGRTIAKLEATTQATRERVDYRSAFDTLSPEEKDKLCPPEWRAQSTRRAALAFFERNSIDVIQKLLDGDPNDETALAQAQEQMLDIVRRNQSARRNPEISASEREDLDNQAKSVTDQHIIECNKLFRASRLALPQYDLPAIQVPRLVVDKVVPPEQCKALSRSMMIQLAALMWHDIPTTPLAVGGVLMLCCLLRPAETCPKFGEVLDCGDYGVYAVLSQAGRGATRVVELKTEAAYRPIVIPRYAMDAIRARRAALEALGYSAEQIANAYIVSRDGDPFALADPKALSGYVRGQLERLGCREDYWAAVSLLAASEPDTDECGGRLADPTAYLLRRNGCSYLTNCAAAPLTAGAQIPLYKLVDLLMGHALYGDDASVWHSWLRRDDNWPLVAQVLETIVLDPDHSAHPAFGDNDDHDYGDRICHVHQRHVVQPGERRITLQIRGHGTDEVVVRLPSHCKVAHREQRLQSKFESRMPVIQELLDPEFYEKEIKNAHKILEVKRNESGEKTQ
jgi:hypothetical protein